MEERGVNKPFSSITLTNAEKESGLSRDRLGFAPSCMQAAISSRTVSLMAEAWVGTVIPCWRYRLLIFRRLIDLTQPPALSSLTHMIGWVRTG